MHKVVLISNCDAVQHVEAYLHVDCSLRPVAKAYSNTAPAQTVLDTTHIFDEHGLANSNTPHFRGQAASIHGQQGRRYSSWMKSCSQVGQSVKETVVLQFISHFL